MTGPDVHALHFAHAWLEGMQRNATGQLPVIQRQEKSPRRRRIPSRQRSKFLGKSLKEKVDAERLSVLEKYRPSLINLFGACRLYDFNHLKQSLRLFDAKHQVHALHRLSRRALHQVIDARNNYQRIRQRTRLLMH